MEHALAIAAVTALGGAWAWLRRRRARARIELTTDRGTLYASLRARARSRFRRSIGSEPEPFQDIDIPTGRHKRPRDDE